MFILKLDRYVVRQIDRDGSQKTDRFIKTDGQIDSLDRQIDRW